MMSNIGLILICDYVPGTSRIGGTSWANAPALNTSHTYDAHQLLTGIAVNNVPLIGYTLNDKNQRTGATLPDGNNWVYGYDPLGQLTGAAKNSSANALLKNFTYSYDQIGNRLTATEDSATTTYVSNLVNQYTLINAAIPTYDTDGNMLTHNGWTYTYNGENRLIAAENSDTRLEFNYDYMGRRFEKKVYTKGLLSLYDWSLQRHRRYAYDGYKLIAEFDAMDNNALLANYLWQPVGLDVPLLAVRGNVANYYFADGNKNILAVKDSSGADLASYTYTPFGAVENPVEGDENPFRFSSEYHDDETHLVYYNYRYYSPTLGRWINRDPIEEQGGVNLYAMVGNNAVNNFDLLGYHDRNTWNNYRKKIKQEALRELDKWYARMQPEMQNAFKNLCSGVCMRKTREECRLEGEAYGSAIVSAVGARIRQQIEKFGDWPDPGFAGNIMSSVGGNGLKCDQWSDVVDNSLGRRSGKFFKITEEISWGLITDHSWTSVRGPCNNNESEGDFGIDFWSSGGRVNDYSIKKSYLRNEF